MKLRKVRRRCETCKTASTMELRPGQSWFCIYCIAKRLVLVAMMGLGGCVSAEKEMALHEAAQQIQARERDAEQAAWWKKMDDTKAGLDASQKKLSSLPKVPHSEEYYRIMNAERDRQVQENLDRRVTELENNQETYTERFERKARARGMPIWNP